MSRTRRKTKSYHHDYYFGPEGMTEHDDWRQASYDKRNQKPQNFGEEVEGAHEPLHHLEREGNRREPRAA